MKEFTSFEEIDRELEIRKLEAQIDKEKLRLNYADFKKAIAPANIALNVGMSVAQNFLYGKIIGRILPFLK